MKTGLNHRKVLNKKGDETLQWKKESWEWKMYLAVVYNALLRVQVSSGEIQFFYRLPYLHSSSVTLPYTAFL